ncbi:glycoside hydrolase family 19 protein [Propionibacteriaceae bacterium G1746]|uniref:glycoside hydrolase family 19 protein n=1 Tax=Aestuariimicrobium sp. G57 TaxID=3418485 RepID=UPI003D58FA78
MSTAPSITVESSTAASSSAITSQPAGQPVVQAQSVPAPVSAATHTQRPPIRHGLIHAPGQDVTLADLTAIFGAKVSTSPRVAEGLPSLNREMRLAGITTPERKAAFLATLAYESTFDYALNEAGSGAYYRGRGYIQLTGSYNYSAAGNHLGVNLAGNPNLAASLEWSAPIARWYWTVHRPHSNQAADGFDMGLISRYIGYGASSYQDQLRCDAFKRAYQHFSGTPAPASTVCYRH